MHKYKQLANSLKREINQQRWLAGEKLPSIRALSCKFGFSINTVVHALRELEAQSIVEASVKRGYFVKSKVNQGANSMSLAHEVALVKVSLPVLFYDIMATGAAFDILPKSERAKPDNALLSLNRAIRRVTRSQAHDLAMYYDAPLGDISLRRQLSLRYRQRGALLNEEQFCITSGCQHALFLALLCITKPGDNVAVESPAFYGVLQSLEQLSLNIIEIPSCAETGMDINALEQALNKWPIKACIVTPSFATPTGARMPLNKQKMLLNLATKFDFTIIEDDIYGDMSFNGTLSPLKALDETGNVILCGSMSKALSKDLRIGWIVGGKYQDRLIRLKLATSLASSKAHQQGLAMFMAEGGYRRHLQQLVSALVRHKQQLIQAITSYLPEYIAYTNPEGGNSLWIALPKEVDSYQLYLNAKKQGITLTPGQLFSVSGHYTHYLRMSFSHPLTGKRLEAFKCLSHLITTAVK
ncbi:PLP-dependent aminotransferase family protein [Thalassotalea sediminis]|uniref:aminotransferase-like domain-containing protein n=1 Tax=Thalassotalea sediminis TaxID=1759089 RepID=UPI002573350D|nr:PLP-dependent aminotransferase family protein [Thalassotalea sediminis]